MKRTHRFIAALLIAVSLAVPVAVSAQNISFGVKAGFNLTNTVDKEYIAGSYYKSNLMNAKSGFNIGMMAEVDIIKYFAVRSGLFLTTRGYTTDRYLGVEYNSFNYYLNVPVDFIGKYRFGNVVVSAFIGPSIYYGLWGKTHLYLFSDSTGAFITDVEYKTFADILEAEHEDSRIALNRFDVGLNIGLGAEFTHSIQVGLNYDFGLRNINSPKYKTDNPEIVRQGTLMVTVAWLFLNM